MRDKDLLDLDNDLDYYNEDIADDDFGIILNADGKLKTVFLPPGITHSELPDTVVEALAVFGIHDISALEEPPTLH